MNVVRLVRVACLTGVLLLAPALVVHADNAPVFETPAGLGPGVRNTTVRMANEQVQVQVVERGSAAIAVVNATFTMVNNGPTVQVLTGFPDEIIDLEPQPNMPAGVYNVAQNITNFRAWTDSATYTPTRQPVTVGQYAGERWFVWNMSYPQGKPLVVHVSYEQELGEQQACDVCPSIGYVPVVYILRTGALWAGNIDDALITFEAPNGGAFVGANGATTVADDKIVWNYKNFKPSSDVGSVYVFAAPWKEMQAAEAAANQPDASPTGFLRAAQNALRLLGADQPYADFSISPFLVDRFGGKMQQWAARANVLNTAESWKALGDVNVFASAARALSGAGPAMRPPPTSKPSTWAPTRPPIRSPTCTAARCMVRATPTPRTSCRSAARSSSYVVTGTARCWR